MKIIGKYSNKAFYISLFFYVSLFVFIFANSAKSMEAIPDFVKDKEHLEIISNSWKVINAVSKVQGKGGLSMEKAAYSAMAVVIADMVRKKIDDDYWAKHGAGPYFVRGYGSKLFILAAVWGSQFTGSFDQTNQRDPYGSFGPNGHIPDAWNFTQFVAQKCNGRSSCDISTNWKDFDRDPSPGQDKILTVQYGCHELPWQPVLVSAIRWDPENNYGQKMHIECK
jgi:hypothetical protein